MHHQQANTSRAFLQDNLRGWLSRCTQTCTCTRPLVTSAANLPKSVVCVYAAMATTLTPHPDISTVLTCLTPFLSHKHTWVYHYRFVSHSTALTFDFATFHGFVLFTDRAEVYVKKTFHFFITAQIISKTVYIVVLIKLKTTTAWRGRPKKGNPKTL